MGHDAGDQATGFQKHNNKQEADGDGIAHLTEVGHQLRAAAVEQVDDVADAKG